MIDKRGLSERDICTKFITPAVRRAGWDVLYYKPNIPLALIEAKDNSFGVGDGMQQGLDYATTLHIPFVFSSNGDGFVFHDRTGSGAETETNLSLDTFPPPAELWGRYRAWRGLTDEAEQIVLQDYFDDGSRLTQNGRLEKRSGHGRTLSSLAPVPIDPSVVTWIKISQRSRPWAVRKALHRLAD
jgi:type I restriction enzyme, R subunit